MISASSHIPKLQKTARHAQRIAADSNEIYLLRFASSNGTTSRANTLS